MDRETQLFPLGHYVGVASLPILFDERLLLFKREAASAGLLRTVTGQQREFTAQGSRQRTLAAAITADEGGATTWRQLQIADPQALLGRDGKITALPVEHAGLLRIDAVRSARAPIGLE